MTRRQIQTAKVNVCGRWAARRLRFHGTFPRKTSITYAGVLRRTIMKAPWSHKRVVGTVVSTSFCNLIVCRLINLPLKEIDLSRSLASHCLPTRLQLKLIAVRTPDRKFTLLIMKNKNYTKYPQRLTLLLTKSDVNLLFYWLQEEQRTWRRKRFRWHLRHSMNEIGNSLHSGNLLIIKISF